MSKHSADIVLLLEGTYPYVRGGVSSWVHQIISGLPHLRFHLIFLGGSRSMYGEMRYPIPDNVVGLDTYYMMDQADLPVPGEVDCPAQYLDMLAEFYQYFHDSSQAIPIRKLHEIIELFASDKGLTLSRFLYSEGAWHRLTEYYRRHCDNVSFVDFFWTLRNLFLPLIKLSQLAVRIPDAPVYHAVSTGYAGFLGTAIAILHKRALLLTEHGIYTKEHKIDLSQAAWIKEPAQHLDPELVQESYYLRQMWIRFFEQLGGCTYELSEIIVSLYEGNRQRQIADGAMPRECRVIPNGTRLDSFIPCYNRRSDTIPMVAALIGRVVPIKDIKTFIRSIKEALRDNPELEGWIVGPYEEDPEYMKECRLLVASLDLADKIRFLGMRDLTEIMPDIGIIVLTSISEAQPLVLLEGMAAGVPGIATDVGACSELLRGGTEADQALGNSGIVVPIANPEATARAINHTLLNRERWYQFQAAGLLRAKQFYDEPLLFQRYKDLYQEVLAWPASDLKSVKY